MRAEVSWDAALEVINAPLFEEVFSQNVLPFVLPFALAIGKLLELCGFFEKNGAAEKKQSPSDPMLLLGFYWSFTSLQGLNCPTTCHAPPLIAMRGRLICP